MSRPLRIEYKDAYYHVMNRGRGRRAIFQGEAYYTAFLDTLAEAHDRFSVQIHAYCLMGNHYHLLIKTPEGNLQRAMRHIGGVYTQRYNRLKRTDGPLFRGRYKAILVDHDAYLLQLSKYIHRNPLEAGLVNRLANYRWSSYPGYIGKRPPAPWLYREAVYGQLQSRRRLAEKYRAFVMDADLDEQLITFYNRKRLDPVLGKADFIEKVINRLGSVDEEIAYQERAITRPAVDRIVAAVAAHYSLPVSAIYQSRKGPGSHNPARQLAMYLAQRVGGYRLKEMAPVFGLKHYGGVGYSISTVKQALEEDGVLERDLNSIINRLDP